MEGSSSRKRPHSNKISVPIAVEWNIKEESLRNAKEDKVESQKFDVPSNPNIQYYLELDLSFINEEENENKNESENEKKVYCFLYLEMKETKDIQANFKITCASANDEINANNTFEETNGWGGCFCLPTEFFDPKNNYIVDGEVCIELTGTLTFDSIEHLKPKILKEKCLNSFDWEDENGKDVIIEVHKKQIKVHKDAISRRSPVLSKLLGIKAENSEVPKLNTLKIGGYLFEVVQQAIMYCYDQPLDDEMPAQDMADLLSFSQKYEMNELFEELEKTMIEKLSGCNVCIFTNISFATDAEKLYQKCFYLLYESLKSSEAVTYIERLNGQIKNSLLKRLVSKVCST